MQARHAHGSKLARRRWADAPEPWRRELRRSTRDQWPRAPIPEITRAYDFARSLDFPVNIDLIAGMLGRRTTTGGRASIGRWRSRPTVTIYQMELPFNTTISADIHERQRPVQRPRRDGRRGGDGCEGVRALEPPLYHIGSA
jgi:hypothetical protein